MLSSFDLPLILISLAVMVSGFAIRLKMWKQGCSGAESINQAFRRIIQLFRYLASHRKILENRRRGIPHLFIFWGFIIPFVVVLISQFRFTLPSWLALSLSLLLDLIGLLSIIGICVLLFERFFGTDLHQGNGSLHLLILLAICVSGFFAEGLRLAIQPDGTRLPLLFSPLGVCFSYLVPASPVLLKVTIRMHFFLVLFFIGYLPFSPMRHAVCSGLSVLYQNLRPEAEIYPISLEGVYFGAGKIQDFPWKALMDTDACTTCGRCDYSCPAYVAGKRLSPQGLIRGLGRKMQETYLCRRSNVNDILPLFSHDGTIEDQDIWSCTTCMACVRTCPVFIRHLSDIISLRQYSVLTASQFPPEYKVVFKNLEIFGDPFGAGKLMREAWSFGLKTVKAYQDSDIEILLWVGCTAALYDDRSRELAIATAKLLDKAAIRYGILGKEEICCGDPARRMGNEYVFKSLASRNIEIISSYGISALVTLCPHCFNIFRNEYPKFGADFEVLHTTQLVNRLLRDGRLKVKRKREGLFTYHDPCYLGRYNGIYREAREILGAILESGIRELPLSGEKGFCCGAGGGGFWRRKTSGKRIEELRIAQVAEVERTGVITSCPYCQIMLDTAAREKDLGTFLKVTDLNALVNEVT